MSNYRTHTLINLVIFLPCCAAGSIIFLPFPLPLGITFAVAFAYGTLYMSPDMDLAHQIQLKSIRGVLSFPFRSYSMVFRHRGLSHSLLFGTLTRVFWLALYAVVLLYLIHLIFPIKLPFKKWLLHYKPYYIAAFAGLFIADTCHLIMDFLHSYKIRRL